MLNSVNIASAKPRVTSNSGINSLAHSTAYSTLTKTGKRACHRAIRRASTHGSTRYKGLLHTLDSLGATGSSAQPPARVPRAPYTRPQSGMYPQTLQMANHVVTTLVGFRPPNLPRLSTGLRCVGRLAGQSRLWRFRKHDGLSTLSGLLGTIILSTQAQVPVKMGSW